jgi:tetratricopeptide (TPR) repeat protein
MIASDTAAREIESGLNAHRRGDLESALSCYQRALAASPDNPDAWNLSGAALHQMGRAEQGLENLRRAVQLRRNDPAILANLGLVCAALGKFAESELAYRKASRIDARQPSYQMGLANALAQQGNLRDAEILLERLTNRYSDQPILWFNHGNVLRDLGRAEDALKSFRRALALQADHIDARNNLGGVLHALLRFDEAEHEYRACLAAEPRYLPARISLASLLIDVGRDAEAETVCREVLQHDPDHVDTWLMLGNAQNHQGRLNAQLDTIRAALVRAPHNARLMTACAGALFDVGHVAEAISMIERVQAIEPNEEKKQAVLTAALLAHGYIESGWLCYRCRQSPVYFRAKYPQAVLCRTLPGDLSAAHIVVQREQGLGDELFFLRYAPLLAARGARITYRTDVKIHTLLQRVLCMDTVLEEHTPIPSSAAVLLLGDLPHALTPPEIAQRQLAAVCAVKPGQALPAGGSGPDRYPPSLTIPPLPGCIDAIRLRLAATGPAPYLGLTWRAGVPPREQSAAGWGPYKAATVTPFAQSVSGFPGTLLALQRAPVPGEIEAFARAAGRPVHDFSDLNDDLEGMLALLALIEEYAGVSNTNMHLRAAAGKTARVLVPAPAEWRWMHSGDASPWFPGFSLYRQDYDGGWQEAWAGLKRDLAQAWPA